MPRKTRRLSRTMGSGSRSFNEAAARCRGKHLPVSGVLRELGYASMRPRPDAAENCYYDDADNDTNPALQ